MAEISTETKKQIIKEFIELHKCQFIDIPDQESIDKIHRLIIKEEVALTTKPVECLYFGWFYHMVKKDYIRMKFYYNLGIEQKESYSMINMSHYYRDVKKNDAKYIKYLLMAIDNGCIVAMRELGIYYQGKKEYDNMKKYYEMAIEKEDITTMVDYGTYFYDIEDYGMMKLYWEMAVEQGSIVAIMRLAYFYDREKEFDLMKKYLSMAIELGNHSAMNYMGKYYFDVEKDYKMAKKYYLMAIEQSTQVEKTYKNINAMINLAYYFRHIEQNYEETKKYLSMACMNKSSEAMIELGHLYQYMFHDYDKAITYYRMAIDNSDNKDNIKAMRFLGQYFQGEKDYDNMKLYFDMAIDKDDDQSDKSKKSLNIKFLCIQDLICHYTNIVKDEDKKTEYSKKLRDIIAPSSDTMAYIEKIMPSIIGMTKPAPVSTGSYYSEQWLLDMLHGHPNNILRRNNISPYNSYYGSTFNNIYRF